MITLTFATRSRTWSKDFEDLDSALAYRRFAYAKWRASCPDPSKEAGQDCPSSTKSANSPAVSTTKSHTTQPKPADSVGALIDKAHAAGVVAVNNCNVIPMTVVQHADPTNDNSPVIQGWHVEGGVCGFAWVRIRPANCAVAKELVKRGMGRKSDQGGIMYWIGDYGQSMQRKQAYAQAFADVLREAGIRAYAESRLD